MLQHLQKETSSFLRKKRIRVKKSDKQWIITVPAIWNDSAKNKMKQWVIKAGLVDETIMDQCKIVYEPDCASLAIQHEINDKKKQKKAANIMHDPEEKNDDKNDDRYFQEEEKYILVDAGGGICTTFCVIIITDITYA